MALLLEAQYAQLSGDRDTAASAFTRMAERADTRLLGLRGLHVEAVRNGDSQRALEYAARAHAIAPLPWAAQAVLDHHASRRDWTAALAAVDSNATHKSIDRRTADRQRAVLLTAAALELGERDPDQVLRFSLEALRLAPGFAPAAVLAATALTRRQEIRKAAKTIEAAWRIMPHPDLARAYLGVRIGDAASDRLARAETLARIDRDHPEARMAVARAAIEAREFLKARRAMAPLIEEGRARRGGCVFLMADLEEAEHGAAGPVREWLARASRAPRDPAWVADGFVSDIWSPVSPVTGRLDAFVWKTPDERLAALDEPPPPVLPPQRGSQSEGTSADASASLREFAAWPSAGSLAQSTAASKPEALEPIAPAVVSTKAGVEPQKESAQSVLFAPPAARRSRALKRAAASSQARIGDLRKTYH